MMKQRLFRQILWIAALIIGVGLSLTAQAEEGGATDSETITQPTPSTPEERQKIEKLWQSGQQTQALQQLGTQGIAHRG